ncbi:MAG TPA: hypothetical protein VHM00_12375 [Caldimonas sp.]|jgi:hypothetical protein|nr:hypothetical protein [Caldimonas sp.]HEX2541864.1 hypothetical protein [Caldimonas sp.]
MKAIFGIVSLLLVLAALSFVARKQLQAIDGGIVKRAPESQGRGGVLAAEPAPFDGGATGGTVAQQARSMQERARDDTVRALQQGVERNKRADTP